MISAENISLQRGIQTLIENASFTVHRGQRVGIVGNNGSGKSSLLALITGAIETSVGALRISPSVVIAHVRQETPSDSVSSLDYVLRGDTEYIRISQELDQAQVNEDGSQLAKLHDDFEAIGGYKVKSRAGQLLHGLGFTQSDIAKPVNSFSGGWRMRLNLAQALMCRSDLLLLDEPTNHLDLHTIVWLQSWLSYYKGVLLLISHDRDFLDNSINAIMHIEHKTIKLYSGNYSSFEKQLEQQKELQNAAWQKQQREIASTEKFISRFKAKATKAKQAQSRIKALDKLERIEAVTKDSVIDFEFQSTKSHLPHTLLNTSKVNFCYGDTLVLEEVSLQLMAGDRIALLGANGAGKSTCIKLLAQTLQPTSGTVTKSNNVDIGYFSQHQLEQLQSDKTPLEHFRQIDNQSKEPQLRAYLGSFGFQGTRVNESIEHFSGGERSRLALGLLVYQQPDVLLLDEPTNHLDINMRQNLAKALKKFSGALIIISHDSHMITQVATSFYLVGDKKVRKYTGTLDQYIQAIGKNENPLMDTPGSKKDTIKDETPQKKQNRYLLNKRLKKIESKIAKLGDKKKQIEQQLANTELYASNEHKQTIIDLQIEKLKLEQEIEYNEHSWLELQEE